MSATITQSMASGRTTMKVTAATRLTTSDRRFLVAFTRCRGSGSTDPRIPISSTPWAAPK